MALHMSSTGIVFSGTNDPAQAAGTGAYYTLDDYEEGSADVALSCGSGTAGFHSGYNSVSYTKIGRMVRLGAWLYITSTSSPSGVLYMTGLPFTVGSLTEDQGYSAAALHYLQAWDALSSGHWIVAGVGDNSVQMHIGSTSGATRENIADHLNNTTTMAFDLTYNTS